MRIIKIFLCCGLVVCFLFFSACNDSTSATIITFGESSSSETILSSSVESSSSLIQSSSSADEISSSSITNYCVTAIDYSMVDSADVITLNSKTENFAAQWAYFDSLFVEHQTELRQIDVFLSVSFSGCRGTRYWMTNGVVDSLQNLSDGSVVRGTDSHPVSEIFNFIKNDDYCGVAGDTAEYCFSIESKMDSTTGMPLNVFWGDDRYMDSGSSKYFRNAIWE